jgi:hypothetical protein
MNSQIKTFVFAYKRKNDVRTTKDQKNTIELHLTQDQFEDYQFLKDAIHAELERVGVSKDEDVYWYQDPVVSEQTLLNLRNAVGAGVDAQLIAYYPHSFNHRHYRTVRIDEGMFHWMPFQGDHFIKFAPAIF